MFRDDVVDDVVTADEDESEGDDDDIDSGRGMECPGVDEDTKEYTDDDVVLFSNAEGAPSKASTTVAAADAGAGPFSLTEGSVLGPVDGNCTCDEAASRCLPRS